MPQLVSLTSNMAAVLGLLLCAISGLARIAGFYYIAGYESTALFVAGTGLMVFACLIKLETLLRASQTK